MNDITKPIQLAVGSHVAGSGRGCAMNVISWENGDKQITDYPECSDRRLARSVQEVNDSICDHNRDSTDPDARKLLCPECSLIVLGLAHRTVGTNLGIESQRVYLTMVRDRIQKILDEGSGINATDQKFYATALKHIELLFDTPIEEWRDSILNDCDTPAAESYRTMVSLSGNGDDTAGTYYAVWAIIWCCDPDAGDPDDLEAFLDDGDMDRLQYATWLLDEFDKITNWTAPVVPDEVVMAAYEQMMVKA